MVGRGDQKRVRVQNDHIAGHVGNVIVTGVRTDLSRTRFNLVIIEAGIRLTTAQCDARQHIATHKTVHRHV